MQSGSDLVIIGAGPAGLFLAHHVARTRPKVKITVLESGGPHIAAPKSHLTSPVYCTGIGGAGKFADKLYFEPAGGWLEDQPIDYVEPFISHVGEIFERFGGFSERQAFSLEKMKKPPVTGLEFKQYKKLVPMKNADYARFIRNMYQNLLENGVTFRFQSRVSSIDRTPKGKFRIKVNGAGKLLASIVAVTTGRTTATWIQQQSTKLGLKLKPSRPWFGVRLEMLASRQNNLGGWNRDPKIKHQDILLNAVTKTHCVCFNGYVISCHCDGMILIDGTSLDNPSKNTSFNIISQVPNVTTNRRCRRIVQDIMKKGERKPLIQTMGDFMIGAKSYRETLIANPIRPTLGDVTPGEISSLLPPEITNNIIDFLGLVGLQNPSVMSKHNLIYAPVYEWFSPKVVIDQRTGESSVPGLYFAGDAASVSQGVVVAAASGLWLGLKVEKKF